MPVSSEIFGERSVNCFKNPVPISASLVAAKKSNFFRVELRQTLTSSLKAVMTLLILMSVAGCSFHSAQWESAKALWAMRAPATQPGQETYWWDMEYEGETYRLFPVAWDGKTVLTDVKRWMIVLQNTEITMIRDFQQNKQITFEDSVDAVVGTEALNGDLDSSGRYFDSRHPGLMTEIAIVQSPLSRPLESTITKTLCLPSRFDSKLLSFVKTCTSAGQEMDLLMAEFDQSGNIMGLVVNLFSKKNWTIYRSEDLVDTFEVKRYLDGDVNEI